LQKQNITDHNRYNIDKKKKEKKKEKKMKCPAAHPKPIERMLIFLTFIFHKVVRRRVSGVVGDNFVSNFPKNVSVKEFSKSLNI